MIDLHSYTMIIDYSRWGLSRFLNIRNPVVYFTCSEVDVGTPVWKNGYWGMNKLMVEEGLEAGYRKEDWNTAEVQG